MGGAVERSGILSPGKDLAEGAGENAPLKPKENFERRPHRIQRSRAKGWRMPPNTVSVTRPGRWGNPYYPGCGLGFGNISEDGIPRSWPLVTSADAVRHFREYMRLMRRDEPIRFFGSYVVPLRGKNLACWCKLGQPCHADVLLEIANATADFREECEEMTWPPR